MTVIVFWNSFYRILEIIGNGIQQIAYAFFRFNAHAHGIFKRKELLLQLYMI